MGKVVGLDLGTTNSRVAYATERGPVVIRDGSGDALLPSVVSVDAAGTVITARSTSKSNSPCSRKCSSARRFSSRSTNAEISGGVNSLSPTPIRTTPPASPPTRNGSRCASPCTSSTPRPMKRFTE